MRLTEEQKDSVSVPETALVQAAMRLDLDVTHVLLWTDPGDVEDALALVVARAASVEDHARKTRHAADELLHEMREAPRRRGGKTVMLTPEHRDPRPENRDAQSVEEDLRHHQCDRSESWWEHDARGIPLARVCDICRRAKLAGYRPEVLTDPGYETDEPIEEDV